MEPSSGKERWKERLHEIIFEAETPLGKAFDLTLLVLILISVVLVSLESVAGVRQNYGTELRVAEWAITLVFTAEYVLRLLSVRRPLRYAKSFFGIVDLLSILPTYLSLLIAGTQSLLVIRALRLLRIFRILKLANYVSEARHLRAALRASQRKITVFMGTVLTAVIIIGAVMYLVEGEEAGFTNIPQSVYWAIVTMTTVGYGDIAPQTVVGKVFASFVMILGYGIIAVPTGIVTVELSQALATSTRTHSCPDCGADGHALDAVHCKFCGAQL